MVMPEWLCPTCVVHDEAATDRWVERTFTVRLDIGTYGNDPDTEEIAYLLRMGGIDAEAVSGADEAPASDPLGPNSGGDQ